MWVCAAVAVLGAAGCTAKYIRQTTDEQVAITPERVERGRYLVENVAMCGACHDGREGGNLAMPVLPDRKLAGGAMLEEPDFSIYIPNITNDPETGIGKWTDDELIRAIRDGVKPDGSFLFPAMPFSAYQHMSDEDVRAVVAYLRSAPAVKAAPRKESRIPFMVSFILGRGVAMHEPVKSVPEPDRADRVKYGEYLAFMGHCTECHSLGSMGPRARDDRWMGGSDTPFQAPGVGKVWASNLTPSRSAGLGNYSAEQIKLALISGRKLDGRVMAPPMSLFVPYVAFMQPEDLDALVAYLMSVQPVDQKVPERELTPEYKKLVNEG